MRFLNTVFIFKSNRGFNILCYTIFQTHSFTFSENLSTGTLNFNMEKCSRQDLLFIKKSSQYFLFNVYESCCIANNRPDHYTLLTTLVCLLVLEFGQEDYLVELVGFVLGIQVLLLLFFFCHADVTSYLIYLSKELVSFTRRCQDTKCRNG